MRKWVVLSVLFAVAAGGCAERSEPRGTSDQDRRAILNEGYSILYGNISSISKGKWVLLFKVGSDSLEQVVNEVSDYAGTLKKTLERIAEDYPAIDIKLEPLPVLERRTRSAAVKSRVLTFMPFVGLSGMNFERRMLQSLEGPLTHLRFLCGVMADEEPEPSLKQVLTDAKDNLDRVRTRVTDLLDAQYYRTDRR